MMLNQVKSKLDCVSKHRFIAAFMTAQHGVKCSSVMSRKINVGMKPSVTDQNP